MMEERDQSMQFPSGESQCNELKSQENLVCDECGRFGAVNFGEKKLCLDCYGSYGSCCPEFGKDEESE
jgi:hypothetical protein